MKTVVLVCLLIAPLLALGDHPSRAPSIQEVKKKHESKFMDMPGVVSVGIGLGPDGKQAIIIGLKEPNPSTEAKIPSSLDGYPVLVKITGTIRAQ